jgi:hypothetical protein
MLKIVAHKQGGIIYNLLRICYSINMITPEQWEVSRSRLLSAGHEVHSYFNIGRSVGGYATLDLSRNDNRQRQLSYPAFLAEGSQPLHSKYMPFTLIIDGSLTEEGVDVRAIPHGTIPLLRIADGFDTPGSGAPQRAEIFRQAGSYVAELWKISREHLPQDLSLGMLSYIREDEGYIAYVPPNQYVHTPNPQEVFDKVSAELLAQGLAPDAHELAQEFTAGIRSVTDLKG